MDQATIPTLHHPLPQSPGWIFTMWVLTTPILSVSAIKQKQSCAFSTAMSASYRNGSSHTRLKTCGRRRNFFSEILSKAFVVCEGLQCRDSELDCNVALWTGWIFIFEATQDWTTTTSFIWIKVFVLIDERIVKDWFLIFSFSFNTIFYFLGRK